MIVYLVKNKMNGKGYVGQTRRALNERWAEHVHNALQMKKEMPIYAAIRKHGADNFEVTVLQECMSDVELNAAEMEWIAKLGTFSNGYNATRGGFGISGYRHTEDAKRRMGLNRSGKKNHNYGKAWGKTSWSEEDIEVVRQKNKVNPRCHLPRTEEDKIKIAKSKHIRVQQLDMSGNILATYDSMLDAEQKTGVGRTGISRCCRFPHRSAGGFRFQYLSGAR